MSSYSVKKPITVLMCALIIIVLGVFSYTRMSLSLFPDVNLPYAVVVTTYPGANPEKVEEEITSKIETSVSTISNFDNVSSTSSEHYAMSIVTFVDGTNMDTAFIDIRESIDRINFNDGIEEPMILRISADMLPVMSFTISRDYGNDISDEEALILTTKWLEEEASTKIKQVDGVADISFTGTSNTQIKIERNELATQLGITDNEIIEVIEKNNFSSLVGFSLTDDGYMMLYIGDTKTGLDQLNEIYVYYDSTTDKTYKFKDVATVSLVNSNDASYSKINGKLGIIAIVQKQSNSSITDVVNGVDKALADLNENSEFPVSYYTVFSQGEYIELAISTIIQNIIIGGLLAVVILFIFLRKIKPTLIVAISMPISIIGTFVLMYFSGINLNIVSMGGLALGLGMLVDNSIVVIENIFRMLNEGKSKKDAAIYGTKGVSSAIIASTMTTIAVFIPIMFLEGMIAEVFIQLALTVCFSLIASLIIALTLVPSISSRILSENNYEIKKTKIALNTEKTYKKVISFALKNKALTLILILILFVGSGLLAVSRGFSLMPKTDEGSIDVTLTLDSKTEFNVASEIADETTEQILEMKDIELVSTIIGSNNSLMSLMSSSGNNVISYSISLKKDRALTTLENKQEIQKIFSEYNYSVNVGDTETVAKVEEIEIEASSSLNYTFGASGLSIVISGNNLQDMKEVSNNITRIVSNIEGVEKVKDNIKIGDKQLRINVDYQKALKNNISTKDIQDSVELFYSSLGISNLISENSGLFYTIDGVDYEFLTNTADVMGMTMSYTDFLGMIAIYDEETIKALNKAYEDGINAYALNSPYSFDGLSLPNEFTPASQKMININPSIEYKVVDGEYTFKTAQYITRTIPYGEMMISFKSYYPDTENGYKLLNTVNKGFIYSTNNDNITNVILEDGFATINTNGKNRTISITGSIKDGMNTTSVSNEITREVNNYLESNEYKTEYNSIKVSIEGENKTTMSAVKDLILCCLIGVLLVYMVMAIQFQSLIYPLIVLGVIPLSFTGGFLACFICGFELSIVAIIGLIILVGIVVNNGIVLIDYINQLRLDGHKIKDAIIEAGLVRLRPILMTSLTTIFGVLPLALGIGNGSEIIQPMAAVVVGGLVFSTLLTLVIIPIVYALFNNKKIKEESIETINK